MPSKTIEDFAYQIKDYMRSAEVVKGKNYLYNNAPTTSTSHHINFTKNADLTITANGNNTDETAAWVKINENVSLPNNDYVLSGGKSATKNISFTIGGTVYKDIGNGVQFTINNTVIPEIILYIKGEVDNEVFSPMICTLDEWNKSHDYEPYYVPVKDSKFDIADQQVLGAWNLLKYPYYDTTKSVSGLDYTDLGDGSVEADGTSTVSNNDFTCFSRGIMNYELEAGTYYVSGCPEGGSESTYHLRISKNKVYNNPSQGFDDLGIDTGDGFSFTLTEKSQLGVVIRVGQTSINHLIFKPMISLEPNQPYVPYAMTNRELTEKSTKRIVTPTVDGTIVKSFESTQTLVEYDLLTRVCTFAFCVTIGTMFYNSANKFMFGFPKPKISAVWFLAACASSGSKKPVGCIIRSVNSEGQFNFAQIDNGTFDEDDLIYCSGSYIIDDSITS